MEPCTSKLEDLRQMAVYGYIHGLQRKYNQNIPKEIIFICILFYGNETEEWDSKYISKYMEVSGKTLKQTRDGMGSSFGKLVIDSGVFKWRLKINECQKYGFILGIRAVDDKAEHLSTCMWFTDGGFHNGYGWKSSTTRLSNNRGMLLGDEYGVEPSNGSIIEMILDLQNLTLSYIIDGKNYGKAFDIKKCKYRLGLYMRMKGDTLTLL